MYTTINKNYVKRSKVIIRVGLDVKSHHKWIKITFKDACIKGLNKLKCSSLRSFMTKKKNHKLIQVGHPNVILNLSKKKYIYIQSLLKKNFQDESLNRIQTAASHVV